jgi:hypothetical protein
MGKPQPPSQHQPPTHTKENDMGKLNAFQWTSQKESGIGWGVGAEAIRGGVCLTVTNGISSMGFNLTNKQAFDLATFISEVVVADMQKTAAATHD